MRTISKRKKNKREKNKNSHDENLLDMIRTSIVGGYPTISYKES